MSTNPSLIEPGLVAVDVDLGSTKEDVIRGLAGIVAATGRADADGLAADALTREGKSPTGMPGGFAIPHCRSAAVNQASLGFARLVEPIDFGAKDGPSDLVFLIAAAESGGADHMKLLTKLARALIKKDFLAALRSASSPDEVTDLVRGVVEPPADTGAAATPARETTTAADTTPSRAAEPVAAGVSTATGAAAAPGIAGQAEGSDKRRTVIAITACPTGIAHTFMAADYLVNAGKELGIDVITEPQGSTATDSLTAEQIASADAVIFATDVGVKGRERFAGKPVIESGVKRAINEPEVMLKEAVAASDNPNAPRVSGTPAADADVATGRGSQLGWGKRIQQALMTGVSYMIPFVAAGGLLIALGFLFGGYQITDVADQVVIENSLTNLPEGGLMQYLGAVLFTLGATSMNFLVAALAGYIAFALADRPGIAPGFTAGAVAVVVGAGFIGGIAGGLIAGLVAMWLGSFKVPRWVRGLMPVVIIPLIATLISGGLMFLLLGRPLAALMTGLTGWLEGMSGGAAILLGVVLGLMMCFDLGGPVNKSAYTFATAGLAVSSQPSMEIMAAVMAAGMVPPLALALATAVRPKLFTPIEQENGRAAWLLGASFISEGAIPFAAADPFRIIPSMMAGGAVTGALIMALGVGSKAPHGGIFVFFAIDPIWGFIVAVLAGMIVSAALVLLLKQLKARAA
ncbi:MAG: fructose-specific PTS transporter subunit EIIC [Propionibacteriaceae bacterium]|nr:fructose-specific PTS transporter subunit EIIC [Propionibacteriaceae bacterium]